MRRLYRSKKNRLVAGVLGGIGEYLNVDPTVIRLVFLVFFFLGAFFIPALFYIAAALIIPNEGM